MALLVELNRRTLDTPIRAKHTAVALARAQQLATLIALVEVDACIGRHVLRGLRATRGAGEYGVHRRFHGNSDDI